MLYENDWRAINHLTLNMYSQTPSDLNNLFENDFMNYLQLLIPHDEASFWLHNHEGSGDQILCNYVTKGFDPEKYTSVIPLIPNEIPHNWINFYEKSIVIRDTDVIQDETKRMNTKYYSSLFQADNIKYALTLSLAHNAMRVGVLTLFRDSNKDDFSTREIEIAEQLVDHIACYAYYVYDIQQYRDIGKKPLTVADIVNRYGLSEREREVLRLILSGHPTKEISSRLFITETTTKKHLSSIYTKLNIHSKNELFKILQIAIDDKSDKPLTDIDGSESG